MISFDDMVRRFAQISYAFNAGDFNEPQIIIRMRMRGINHHNRFYAEFEGVEEKGHGVLIGTYGNGETPEEALRDFFNKITGKTLVYHASGDDRKEVVIV